jgi:hypothetical protein
VLGVGRLVLGAPTLKMHGRASVASTTRPPVRRPSFERVALARKRPGLGAHAGITDQGYHPTSLMVSSHTFWASASVMWLDDTMTAYVSEPVSTAVIRGHCRPSNTEAIASFSSSTRSVMSWSVSHVTMRFFVISGPFRPMSQGTVFEITLDLCLLFLGPLFVVQPVDQRDWRPEKSS